MAQIARETTLVEVAARVSEALEKAGVTATLSGGAAVSVYSDNEYESYDLDFVSNAELRTIEGAIAPLGFTRVGKGRYFEHPDSPWYLEFPPGPLGFGETSVRDADATVLRTESGQLRIVTPTQIIMDRLAAYAHWHDNQSLDQAVMVAARQNVDWPALSDWARRERIDPAVVDGVRRKSVR